MLQQRDGRQLRPVQVVEDDDQRSVAGDRPEQRRDGFEQVVAAVAAGSAGVRGRWRAACRDSLRNSPAASSVPASLARNRWSSISAKGW